MVCSLLSSSTEWHTDKGCQLVVHILVLQWTHMTLYIHLTLYSHIHDIWIILTKKNRSSMCPRRVTLATLALRPRSCVILHITIRQSSGVTEQSCTCAARTDSIAWRYTHTEQRPLSLEQEIDTHLPRSSSAVVLCDGDLLWEGQRLELASCAAWQQDWWCVSFFYRPH